MTMYLKYFQKVMIHKWYVLLEGLKIHAPLYLLILHDWSKFLPDEFIAYAKNFNGPYKYNERPKEYIEAFNKAWLFHQHRNKHHWQYWFLVQDSESPVCVEMPSRYVYELVADWRGAGRAYGKTSRGDNPNTKEWYLERKTKIMLHPKTRILVEKLLGL